MHDTRTCTAQAITRGMMTLALGRPHPRRIVKDVVRVHGIPDGIRERPTKAAWLIRDTDVEKKVGA